MKKFFEECLHVTKVWVNEAGEWFTAPHIYGELYEMTREEVLAAEDKIEESKSKKSK